MAVRELNLDGVPESQRNWLNDHTVYTHGFGFIGAYGNRRTGEGDPQFFSNGFSTKGPAGVEYEPRIYFGEQSPTYSIVGAPEGAKPREFDYPDDQGEGGQANTTFDGDGGVRIGSFIRKVAYAVKYREPKFLLSDAVNSESRILDHRMPRERVERVAPWLTIDGNAYPAVVDGRVKWIVDGYTTTARYPNSRLTDLSDATADAVSDELPRRRHRGGAGQLHPQLGQGDGRRRRRLGQALRLGHERPHPQGVEQGVPRLGVRRCRRCPRSSCRHVRYPQDLFKVQRQLLASYHVTDANSFYGGGDFWRVPKDPTPRHPGPAGLLPVPGHAGPDDPGLLAHDDRSSRPEPGREILRGFLAVDADAGSAAGQAGRQLRLACACSSCHATRSVDGPGQVQNQIEVSTARSQSPTEPLNLSQFIAQNRQSGKQLTYGNLLTLPVGEGLLYVQPMYVQASREGGSFPQNKATVAVFGKKIAWGETLDQALDGLFGGNSGASAGDSGITPEVTPPTGEDPGTTAPSAQLAEVIRDIEAANAAGQEALKKGDFAAYGAAQKDLQDAIARAAALSPQLTATPSSSATPTPTPTPSSTP